MGSAWAARNSALSRYTKHVAYAGFQGRCMMGQWTCISTPFLQLRAG